MYNRIKASSGISGFYFNEKYQSYTLTTKEYKSKLIVKNWNDQTVFTSDEERVNRLCLFQDVIAYVPRIEAKTKIVILSTKGVNEIRTVLNNLFTGNPHIYNGLYYNLSEVIGDNRIYDLVVGRTVRVVDTALTGFIVMNTSEFLVTKKDLYIYTYNKIDFSLLWQKDFSYLAEYIELDGEEVLGDIRQIWSYNGHIMVLTQMFIFKLSSETGEVIQQQKLSAGFMELCVNENKAYGCYGYHFIEIDLDTLDILCFKRMECENYEGQELFTLMNKAVYHEGLVFHAVRLEGGLHCVGAIQPKTGERIWLHPVGVNDINSIAFHNNKMFVHDIGSTLHIFERNTKL